MYSLDMKNKDYFSRVKELESLAETELLRNECNCRECPEE